MTDLKKNNGSAMIPDNCKLYEMVQYQCEANKTNIECTPFVRLFLRCAGLPTVEVTPEYDQYGDPIDSSNSISDSIAANDSKTTTKGE